MSDEPVKNKIVSEARERYKRARDAYSKQRQQAIEDTKFVMGDSDNKWQWPDEIYNKREAGKRVALTVNLTAQHCNQIINEIRRNQPSVKVSPADSAADPKTAEMIGGLIRQTLAASSADEAHINGAEHAIYGGEGFWRVITEYENESSFNQVLRIKWCPNPNLVLIDPDTLELDRSDANWGFLFEDLPKDEVKRAHPGIDPSSWADNDKTAEWYTDDTIRIAEYFYCDYKKDTAYLLSDGTTRLKSKVDAGEEIPLGVTIEKERPTEIKSWHWCKLVGGHDEPVDKREWLGKYLPIIMVVGKELNVDGKVIRKGQVRDLKDPARMVNYAYSETVQTLALQNKIPYMGAAEAIEGYEDQWKTANTSDESILFWNAYDQDGKELPKPERQPSAVMPAAQIQLLQLSTEQMRAASGQQASNFGIRSEAQSGIGIQRLKVQGEIATFHFPDNLTRALRYEAKVLLDLIQKYYDSRRVVRILGLDGEEQSAILDPNQQEAYKEEEKIAGQGMAIERIFNPNVGLYDVVISVGPSFQTQRQESAVALADMSNHAKDPLSASILSYLAVKSADFAGSDEAAEMLRKALPPEFHDDKDRQPQIPPQVAQQMQMMGQQMQMMQQALQETQGKLQEAEAGAQTQIQKAMIDADTKLKQAEIDAAAKQQQAEIDAENEAAIAIRKANIEATTKIRVALIEQNTKRELTEIEGQFGLAETEIACMTDMEKHAMTMDAQTQPGEPGSGEDRPSEENNGT